MTAIVGNDGNFSGIASGAGLLNRWRATFAAVISEVTPFGATKLRGHRAGLIDITGSASGSLQKDVASSQPDIIPTATTGPFRVESTLVLTVATGCTLTFLAIMSSIAFDVNKVGDALVTFDFMSGDTDVLTEVWDEA